MSISVVQTNGKFSNGLSSDTLAFSSSVTAGNSIIVKLGGPAISGAAPGLTVTDNKGNSYTREVSQDTGSGTPACHVFRSSNVIGGSITVTTGWGAANSWAWSIEEVAANLTIDQHNSNNGTSTSADPGSITTTHANEYVAYIAGALSINGPPTGYTETERTASAGESSYKLLTSTGTEHPIATLNVSGAWAAIVASYFDSNAAPAAPQGWDAIDPGQYSQARGVRSIPVL